jgi:hypothetical protein
MKGKQNKKNSTHEGNSDAEARPIGRLDLSQVEFHRQALALIPSAGASRFSNW